MIARYLREGWEKGPPDPQMASYERMCEEKRQGFRLENIALFWTSVLATALVAAYAIWEFCCNIRHDEVCSWLLILISSILGLLVVVGIQVTQKWEEGKIKNLRPPTATPLVAGRVRGGGCWGGFSRRG